MIEIVYPEPTHISNSVIEQLFADAVCENLIPPDKLAAKTPQEMAEALENIGWIHLASK